MSGRQVIERVWQAPIGLVWELWTTAEGLASWWGPGGFTVEVPPPRNYAVLVGNGAEDTPHLTRAGCRAGQAGHRHAVGRP